MSEIPTLDALAMLIARSRRVVVLTGLQLDARERVELSDDSGEWARRASLEALLTNPADFWDYYLPNARQVAERPATPGHEALARLQAAGLVQAIVTQAVDRLHRRAACSPEAEIVEVHGNVLTMRCTRCHERYALAEADALMSVSPDGVPRCSAPGCAMPLRPAATMWGEPLFADAVSRAWELAGQADCFLVVDSELRTVPMSLLPSVPLTRGVPLAMVGVLATQYDRYAEVLMRESSSDVLPALADLLAPREVRPPDA